MIAKAVGQQGVPFFTMRLNPTTHHSKAALLHSFAESTVFQRDGLDVTCVCQTRITETLESNRIT